MFAEDILAFILILIFFVLFGVGIFLGYWFFIRRTPATPLQPPGDGGLTPLQPPGDGGILPLQPPGDDATPLEQPTRLRVKNNSSQILWIQNENLGSDPPIVKLPPGGIHDYKVPDAGLSSVRVWAKTNCKEDGTDCETGQSLQPCPENGCQPPYESKAEFTFADVNNKNATTFYNVSFVDGWTLPISIIAKGDDVGKGQCTSIDCSDLTLDKCPTNDLLVGDLQVKKDGRVIACMSPCQKAVQPKPLGMGVPVNVDPALHMCCPTPERYIGKDGKPTADCTWANGCATSEACSDKADPHSVVNTEYYKTIKKVCPSSYGYAYDDNPNNTPVLMTCSPDTKFEVVFG